MSTHITQTSQPIRSGKTQPGLDSQDHQCLSSSASSRITKSQQEDGGFAQNFWIDGGPYWRGIQLDEVALPILWPGSSKGRSALQDFDPYPMILKAAAHLVRHGPVTEQERWEEASGYSPSTLASNIAALIGAAWFARERGDDAVARMLEEYADFLECHIEAWTVTTEGSLVPGIQRHYIRILPEDVANANPVEDPNSRVLQIKNQPDGSRDHSQQEISLMRAFFSSRVMG